jgi:hypothetical protein
VQRQNEEAKRKGERGFPFPFFLKPQFRVNLRKRKEVKKKKKSVALFFAFALKPL